jgi:hypothetical protein
MSSVLVQTPINSPGATLALQCLNADKSNSLQLWLTNQGILYAESIEYITGVGLWCFANGPDHTYYTLTQAIDAGNGGGWYYNDTAWLMFTPAIA